MGKYDKLRSQILQGAADTNISFKELCQLLSQLGFDERTRSSHHIFRKAGIEEKINLQKDGSHAKPYQVRQVRSVLLKYRLGDDE
ncbi:MAG: type II toxin-antitoxin system HicA family toxin [Candidatus Parabeggiatoa sp. nov. 1]|nr:MAG: type II toxin-antitoxin system HicA family toxin [Gammaproteobacteria bacterium]